ncbi:MAG: hypothetical protein ABIP00_12055, partial [Pyrinomonadaceae bacterium]
MARTLQINESVNNNLTANRNHYLAAVVATLLAFSVILGQSDVGMDRRSARVSRNEAGHPLT